MCFFFANPQSPEGQQSFALLPQPLQHMHNLLAPTRLVGNAVIGVGSLRGFAFA